MRTIGTLPSLRASRNPLVSFGVLIAVMYAAYQVAQAILANDLTGLGFAAVLLLGGAVFIAVLNDWHRGLYLLIAWILFEDFVRKYLGNNMVIYFGKVVLAIVLYISFFRAMKNQKIKKFTMPFRVPLLIFVWFCVLQMFNPASPTIFYGILGLQINFLYIPLFYIGYAFIESEADLQRLFSFVCTLILIVAGLGLAQSIVGPTFLNPKVMQEDIRDLSTLYRAAPISGALAYRPTSVFVSAGRFQDFLMVSWLISLGYGGYLLLRSRKGRTLAFTTVGVVAAASVMSASRGVFMWNTGGTLLIVAGFLWGAPWRQREALRVVRAIQRTSLLIGMGLIILLTIFPKELGSRVAIYSETLMPDSPASELVHRTQTYPIQQLEYAFSDPRWPYGYGLGTCTLGTQYVIRIMHAARLAVGVESGFGNIVVELGVVGLILWIVLGVAIGISSWKVVTQLRGTPWFPLAYAILLYVMLIILPMEFTGNGPYQDFVLNSDLWLFLGVLYRLRLFPEALEQAQLQAAAGQA